MKYLKLGILIVFFIVQTNYSINCLVGRVFGANHRQTQDNGFIYRSREGRSVSKNETRKFENTTRLPTVTSHKKWQVGRVSRKQYEIINMLWRKTNIFEDVDRTTKYVKTQSNASVTELLKKSFSTQKHSSLATLFRSALQSSTPSFIEFYYLDEVEVQEKPKDATKLIINSIEHKPVAVKFDRFKNFITRSPLISFHVNDPKRNQRLINFVMEHGKRQNRIPQRIVLGNRSHNYPFRQPTDTKIKISDLFINNTLFGKKLVTVKMYLNGSLIRTTTAHNKPKYTHVKRHQSETKGSLVSTSMTPVATETTKASTIYDKIKFFEIYDRNTAEPTSKLLMSDISNKRKGDDVDDKMINENVKRNIEHPDVFIKARYKNKHGSYERNEEIGNKKDAIVMNESYFVTRTMKTYPTEDSTSYTSVKKRILTDTKTSFITNSSKPAVWSDYPFIGVYVYEPSKTHCDAAGISSHWLVAAGSCLSRHHLEHSPGARSAFVTYCGVHWRQPDRIAYVKYSLVHPRFHPQDRTRKNLYNIGLIQVASSMSACNNWSPVTLMSHNFAARPEGSVATAIGWGVDRHGAKFDSENVPQWPLMVYDGLVYSESCPGSSAYSKENRLDEEIGAKNVFCLTLPPYAGEERDPVHGGLLLVEGKLIALYLQEERRQWGPQSAQYTGVWRLIPWVQEVAREPDDMDGMALEM